MILDQLKSMQIQYLKTKDLARLGVLRFLLSQIQNKEIELRPQNQEITDEIVFKVVKKHLKQKNEAFEMCKKAGREEAALKENEEIEIIKEFVKLFPSELQAQL